MELVHGVCRSDPGRLFTSLLSSYIPISMDLSFIWRILTFSVSSKNLKLNFSLVMLQILSCLYDIFVLSYALLKPNRHQIPCQIVREEFLRALPLNSTKTFPDYMAWLNFTALKFKFISCRFLVFFPCTVISWVPYLSGHGWLSVIASWFFFCLILYVQLSVLFRGCLSTELEQLLVLLIRV